MKVLVVEDDENKRLQVVSHLQEVFGELKIVERRSYQSGLAEILNEQYDAVLLDMTMPTFDKTPREGGGRLRPFAGRDILSQIQRKKLSLPVIVVTGFESFGEGATAIALSELKRKLASEFPKLYQGSVYYNSAQSQWKDDLTKLLSPILGK